MERVIRLQETVTVGRRGTLFLFLTNEAGAAQEDAGSLGHPQAGDRCVLVPFKQLYCGDHGSKDTGDHGVACPQVLVWLRGQAAVDLGDACCNRALQQERSFKRAFERAKPLVAEWESEDGLRPSLPQIAGGEGLKDID